MITTVLILVPLAAALAIWIVPWPSQRAAGGFALLVALGELALWVGTALNFDFGDSGGQYLVELENGVLNHTADRQAEAADATVTLARGTLNDIILKQTTLADAISAGEVNISGDRAKLDELISYLDNFEFWFNIVTPNATN